MRNIYDACLTYENNLKAKVAQNMRRVLINSKFKLCGNKSKIHEKPKLHARPDDLTRDGPPLGPPPPARAPERRGEPRQREADATLPPAAALEVERARLRDRGRLCGNQPVRRVH